MISVSDAFLDDLLGRALAEDLGEAGDITSKLIFGERETARAVIKAKEAGVLSGTGVLGPLFRLIDPAITVEPCAGDGARLEPQTAIARLAGPIRGILAGERIALNFLQRLSGIATQTARLSGLIAHTRARLLDTRKTTPTLRPLEKQAVLHGGGFNHRFGLYDMVLIKDTHVKAAGGPAPAVRRARRDCPAGMPVEVEVQTREQFIEAAPEKPDRIMLDNMAVGAMRECVLLRDRQYQGIELEASGNVTAATIVAIAETGVDFISSGAITHSVTALDIHLVIV